MSKKLSMFGENIVITEDVVNIAKDTTNNTEGDAFLFKLIETVMVTQEEPISCLDELEEAVLKIDCDKQEFEKDKLNLDSKNPLHPFQRKIKGKDGKVYTLGTIMFADSFIDICYDYLDSP